MFALAAVRSPKWRQITVYCKPKHHKNWPTLTRKPPIGKSHTLQTHAPYRTPLWLDNPYNWTSSQIGHPCFWTFNFWEEWKFFRAGRSRRESGIARPGPESGHPADWNPEIGGKSETSETADEIARSNAGDDDASEYNCGLFVDNFMTKIKSWIIWLFFELLNNKFK